MMQPALDMVENIDIGGPAMIRAAAKNHDFVTILTDADDYDVVLSEIAESGGVDEATRRKLAAKAFAHTAEYDATIAAWMRDDGHDDALPKSLSIGGSKIQMMRYGENPHQEAALYQIQSRQDRKSVLGSEQVQGKPLSFNNIMIPMLLLSWFQNLMSLPSRLLNTQILVVLQVVTPLTEVWKAALASDPVSAFGGIIALNRKLEGPLAEEITKIFTEVVIAPDADEEAKSYHGS